MTTVKNLNVESINKALIEIQNYFDNTEIKDFIAKNKNLVESLIAALNFISLEYNDETTELTWIDNKGVKSSWYLLGTIYNLTVDGDEVVLVNNNNGEEVHITVPYSVKATNDSDGNNIISTYSTKTENNTLEQALTKLINDGLDAELKRAQKAESDLDKKLDDGLKDINDKIPAEASPTNQLADKAYVDTAITQNTAFFRGTFKSETELKAYKGELTNNDYAFVSSTSDDFKVYYGRYKYNASSKEWKFEYYLDNEAYTNEQWAAVNSGITKALREKLEKIEDEAEVNVQADWTETVETSDAFIKNKPNVTATTHGADKTISEWSETNGVVDIKFQDIDITHNQINDWPDFKDVATSASYYDLIDAPGNFKTITDANLAVPDHTIYGQQWYYCSNTATNTPGKFSYFISSVRNGNFITQTAYTERTSVNNMSPLYVRIGVASGKSWNFGNWLSQDCSTYYFDSDNGATQYLEIDFSTTSGIRLDCNHGGYYIFEYNSKPIVIGVSTDNCVKKYKWDTTVSSKPKLFLEISTYNLFNIKTDGTFTKIKKLDSLDTTGYSNDFEKVIFQSTLESINVSKVGGDGKYISAISQSKGYITPTVSTADVTPTKDSKTLLTSGGAYTAIKNITDKIPSQASSTNQLADKDFVNSSISTNTATFYGSFSNFDEFTEYQTNNKTFTNNDYAVVISDETHSNQMSRYKYNGKEWMYEYKVNDTPFTSEQLSAINSGITKEIIEKIPKLAETNITKNGEITLTSKTIKPEADIKVSDPEISILKENQGSVSFVHNVSNNRLSLSFEMSDATFKAEASNTNVSINFNEITIPNGISDKVTYTASTKLKPNSEETK